MIRIAPFVVTIIIAVADARLLSEDKFSSVKQTKPANGRSDHSSDPDPKEILRRLSEFYKHCKTIQVQCDLVETERWPKEKEQHPNVATISITAERPNRLAFIAKWENFEYVVICDGKTLSNWVGPPPSSKAGSDPVPKMYWQGAAPPSLAELAESRLFMGPMGWPEQPVVLQLLTDEPYEDLMEGVTAISYVGEEKRDGVRVHRLKFARNVFSWEAWIAADGAPVLQEVAIDTTHAVMFATGGRFGKVSATITQRFKDWRFDPAATRDAFVFNPASGATKSTEPFGFAVTVKSEAPRVGQQTSAVELKTLDHGTIKLGRHIGRDVVVLVSASQFFNPFGNQSAILRNMAARYRNRGVVVYLVNIGIGDEDRARREAKDKTFAGVVALDDRREVAKALGIDPASSSVDFLALIDIQGVIQAVHDPFCPSKARLKRELDTLLAGKRLLTPAQTREAR